VNTQPRRRRRASIALAAAAAGGLLLAACSSSSSSSSGGSTPAAAGTASAKSSSGKSITIGFSPYNQSAPALVGLGKSLKAYAGTKGDKVLVADPNNNSTSQVQQIESWIQLGQVQAVWVLPLDPATMAPVLALAQQHHVAMLAAGVPSDFGKSGPGPGLSFSVIKYSDFGHAVGEALGKCIVSRLGGKGQVLDVENPPGSTDLASENAGFLAGLMSAAPASKIVATVSSANDQLTAQQNSLTAIQGHPGVNAVAGFTDEGSLGGLAALKLGGKNPAASCSVGAGGSPQAISDVKAGQEYAYVVIQFQADLEQNVIEMGKMAADISATGTQLYTPFDTITK
jgi:ABC-type sugar transport system substrate-binding protein